MRLYSINTFLACAFKKKLTSLICEASSLDQMEFQFDVSPISSIALLKCLVYYTWSVLFHFEAILTFRPPIRFKHSMFLLWKCFPSTITYHRGAVLKDEFPEKTNCRFGFSMVDNLRRRWDLVGVLPKISKKKFSKKQRISSRQNEKKILRAGFEPVSRAPTLYISHSATCESFLSLLFHIPFIFFQFFLFNANIFAYYTNNFLLNW